MNAISRILFAGVLFVAATPVFAVDNDTGSGGGTYADCMNGCWKSHDYCKEHQSAEVDCDHQLGQCIEYCESEYDPQSGPFGKIVVLPKIVPKKLVAP